MRIFFDQGTPAPLRIYLVNHQVSSAFEMGWAKLSNGDLLNAAEELFELLITTDQNLRYQQDLSNRRLAILVLPTTSWPKIEEHQLLVANTVSIMQPGEYRQVAW